MTLQNVKKIHKKQYNKTQHKSIILCDSKAPNNPCEETQKVCQLCHIHEKYQCSVLTYAQSAKWSATIFFWRKQRCSRVPPEKKTMHSRNIYSDFQFINLCRIDSQNHQRRVALNNNIREQKYRTQLKSIPENPESCITVRPSSIKWRKSTTNLPISSWTNSRHRHQFMRAILHIYRKWKKLFSLFMLLYMESKIEKQCIQNFTFYVITTVFLNDRQITTI